MSLTWASESKTQKFQIILKALFCTSSGKMSKSAFQSLRSFLKIKRSALTKKSCSSTRLSSTLALSKQWVRKLVAVRSKTSRSTSCSRWTKKRSRLPTKARVSWIREVLELFSLKSESVLTVKLSSWKLLLWLKVNYHPKLPTRSMRSGKVSPPNPSLTTTTRQSSQLSVFRMRICLGIQMTWMLINKFLHDQAPTVSLRRPQTPQTTSILSLENFEILTNCLVNNLELNIH